ncbi:putative vacuolar membrane protein [Erysiphe neolycopersici]|uniref:Putative vacuolar membrane protein n=1 Tax=Erysiphe neolycopersici TaxID=212602 RepID=A0A420HEK2_9PEZI|nr:putative vacuolar membrane protein [Erysiphe neolycopersici]
MGCSGRVKAEHIRPEQKWEFIILNDFHSTSYFNPIAYAYLWASLVISGAVYGVDTFTAVNLLAYDRWTSEVDPFIPLNISKWIFSVCIIASLVNLAFEQVRAMRVIRRGAVAESYLDSLAARLQSTRFRSGWKRFLVFAELTKSKKGAEYVALFTYFSFQSWIRIVFCQGPRQVINALTLYSVLKPQYDSDQPDIGVSLLTFFKNLGILADKNEHQVIILSAMAFTLVIWGFGALRLLFALLAYLLFLWHYIPKADGGLSRYCERKINTRLAQIVSLKVNKAIEQEERKRQKAGARAVAKGNMTPIREATLPKIFDRVSGEPIQDLSPNPNIYACWSPLPNALFSHQIDKPSNQATSTLSSIYGAKIPLLQKPADMGYSRPASPAPSLKPSEIRGFPSPLNQDYNQSSRLMENSTLHRLTSRVMSGNVPAPNISSRSETLDPHQHPRPFDNSYPNSSFQVERSFVNNNLPIMSRPGTPQSLNRPIIALNTHTAATPGFQRVGSPSPYYNGHVQGPGFPGPNIL